MLSFSLKASRKHVSETFSERSVNTSVGGLVEHVLGVVIQIQNNLIVIGKRVVALLGNPDFTCQ